MDIIDIAYVYEQELILLAQRKDVQNRYITDFPASKLIQLCNLPGFPGSLGTFIKQSLRLRL